MFVLSTVPSFAARFYPSLWWQVIRTIYFLIWVFPRFVIGSFGKDVVYIKVNGGFALIFDSIFAAISRLIGKRLILHHNSFSYLNERSRLAAQAFRMAGPTAKHIVNCGCMQNQLETHYGLKGQALLLSNATILGAPDVSASATGDQIVSKDNFPINPPLRVGYMSYYTEEKGIGLFGDTIQATRRQGAKITALAAGIIHDQVYFDQISKQYSGSVEFCGPQYGDAKEQFFAGLDILLFPSKYRTEAEPLVVYDALAQGIPVVATQVGCLSEMLDGYTHCHSFPIEDYQEKASKLLIEWSAKSSAQRQSAKQQTAMQYRAQIKTMSNQMVFI